MKCHSCLTDVEVGKFWMALIFSDQGEMPSVLMLCPRKEIDA